MDHGLAHLLLAGLGAFDHRQAHLGAAWPISSAAYFTGAGLVSHEHRLVQRHQPVLDLEHLVEVARLPGVVHVAAQPRRHVGGHRDAAVAALRHEAHGAGILARELQEALLGLELGERRPRHVVARVLDADDVA